MTDSALVLVREYNDADHILPIVYALREAGMSLTLLSFNTNARLASDPRFAFIARHSGVRVVDTLEYHPGGIAGWIVAHSHRAARAFFRKLGKLSKLSIRAEGRFALMRRKLCNAAWAESLLRRASADVMVLEWGDYAKSGLDVFVTAAQRLAVPIISVPHGMNINWNFDQSWASAGTGKALPYGEHLSQVDCVVSQHQRWADYMIDGGVPREKLMVLGSARYCDEWQKTLDDIYSARTFGGPGDTGKLKIVYMDHGRIWRMHGDAVERSLRRIASLEFVSMVVKPNTRNDRFSTPALEDLTADVSDIPSVELIRWADVVVCAASSILVEALIRGKTLIYPKHHHDNEGIIERFDACWQVNNDDELVAALHTLQDGKPRQYTETAVDQFLSYIVRGGHPGRDVLNDYVSTISAYARDDVAEIASLKQQFGSTHAHYPQDPAPNA